MNASSPHSGPQHDRARSAPWRLFGRLTRWRLSLAVAGTAVSGALFQAGARSGVALLLAGGGVALLAAAGSAGNQLQERDLDGKMRRTCLRPLPQGQLTPRQAMAVALGLGGGGLALLLMAGPLPALFGGMALACYNGVYTPLKRITPLALLPGALCGALPPLIGWCAAGGNPADFRILLIATLIYLWQLPHFWRLADRHADDYRRAGLPVLQDCLSPRLTRLARLSWTLALVAVSLQLPLFGLLRSLPSRLLLTTAAAVLALSALWQGAGKPGKGLSSAPAWADLCLVLLLLLLLGERLLLPVAATSLSDLRPLLSPFVG